MRIWSFVLVLTVMLSLPLAGQWPAGVTSGARVQVRLPEVQYQIAGPRGHLIRGRVTGLARDTLYLSVTDSVGPLAIPRRLIDRLQLSRGVPSRWGSAMRGGLIAAAITSLVSVGLNELDDDPGGPSAGTAALVGAGIGLATGGVTGALFPTERWKRVQLGGGE
jgi:hypothetical protein